MRKSTTISRTLLDKIMFHAACAYPYEACGILLGQSCHIDFLMPAENVAHDPKSHFEMDPRTLVVIQKKARERKKQVIGCYHSHPNGKADPSPEDARHAFAGWIWLISAGTQVYAYRTLQGGKIHGWFEPMTLNIDEAI